MMAVQHKYNAQNAFLGSFGRLGFSLYDTMESKWYLFIYLFILAQEPPVGHGLLILEVSRSLNNTPQ